MIPHCFSRRWAQQVSKKKKKESIQLHLITPINHTLRRKAARWSRVLAK